MPETTNPSDQEFLDALVITDQRVGIAQSEIVRRLEANVPGKIAALNTKLGYPAGKGIQPPKGYWVAPAQLNDKYINTILVSVALSTEAHSPGVFRNESQVVIYSIDRKIEVPTQVEDAWARAAVVRGVLRFFLTGCEDAEGRQCWRLLEPTGVTMLPQSLDPDSNYSGTACYYRMVQDPTFDNWI